MTDDTLCPDPLWARRHGLQTVIAVLALATCTLPTPAWAQSRPVPQRLLPTPTSLQRAVREAAARGEPLVLMVSLPGCPWCELLRRNYLGPMRSEMPRPLMAYEISITDHRTALVDLDGRASTARAVSDRLRVSKTPTVLFFNAQGQEVAPRIEGVASAELIGAVLDERIGMARRVLAAPRPAAELAR